MIWNLQDYMSSPKKISGVTRRSHLEGSKSKSLDIFDRPCGRDCDITKFSSLSSIAEDKKSQNWEEMLQEYSLLLKKI